MARPRVLLNALSVTHGGGHSYLVNLLRELERDDRGFEFAVAAPAGALASVALRRVAVERLRLPGRPRALRLPARLLGEALDLPRRAARFDLLYGLADLAAPWTRTPTVVALRNLNIYDRRFYDTARLRWLARLARPGLARARRLVIPSHAAARQLRDVLALAPERVAVVPHGIACEAFDPDPPAPHDAPYVFLPAALERHKNVGVLVESLRHVADPRLQAWIAGPLDSDPGCTRELRARVRDLGLEARVRLLGPVPYRRVLGYYRGARAFVFPSLLESFGHPLLEAMLAETPIVAADLPVFREIAGDAAAYFPARDPSALARALDRVQSEVGTTKERIARGRQRVAGFTWKRSVDALCGVFQAVLAEARG